METDDARETLVLAFNELTPWSARFEFLCYWNGSKMKPSYDYTLVNAEAVAPAISIAKAEEGDGEEQLAAKAGHVRRRGSATAAPTSLLPKLSVAATAPKRAGCTTQS